MPFMTDAGKKAAEEQLPLTATRVSLRIKLRRFMDVVIFTEVAFLSILSDGGNRRVRLFWNLLSDPRVVRKTLALSLCFVHHVRSEFDEEDFPTR